MNSSGYNRRMEPYHEKGAAPEGDSEEALRRNLLKTTGRAGKVFAARILSQIAALTAGVVYARFLGADLYGVFQLAITAVSVLSLLAAFGMSPGLIRYLPIFKADGKMNDLKGTVNFALSLGLFLSVAAALALYLGRQFVSLSVFSEPRLSGILPLFSLVLVFYSLGAILGGVIQAEGEAHVFITFRYVLDHLASVSFFLVFYLTLGTKLLGASWAKVFASFLTVFLAGRWVVRRFPFLWKKPLFPTARKREFLLYSASLLFVGFTYFLMNQVNNLLVGMYSVSRQVGFYSVGNVVAGVIIFVLISFNLIFAPLISELYHRGQHETLAKMYSAVTRLVWIFTLPIFIWVLVYSRSILSIFGEEFAAAKWVLIFLAIGQFVNAAVGPNGLMLSMSGHQKWEVFNGVAVALLNIGVNMVLIPRYGATGAALGGALALVAVNLAKTLEVWYVMKMLPYNGKFFKPMTGGVVGAVGLLILKRLLGEGALYAALGAAVSGALVLGTVFLLGLEEEDKFLLRAVRSRIVSLVGKGD